MPRDRVVDHLILVSGPNPEPVCWVSDGLSFEYGGPQAGNGSGHSLDLVRFGELAGGWSAVTDPMPRDRVVDHLILVTVQIKAVV